MQSHNTAGVNSMTRTLTHTGGCVKVAGLKIRATVPPGQKNCARRFSSPSLTLLTAYNLTTSHQLSRAALWRKTATDFALLASWLTRANTWRAHNGFPRISAVISGVNFLTYTGRRASHLRCGRQNEISSTSLSSRVRLKDGVRTSAWKLA